MRYSGPGRLPRMQRVPVRCGTCGELIRYASGQPIRVELEIHERINKTKYTCPACIVARRTLDALGS